MKKILYLFLCMGHGVIFPAKMALNDKIYVAGHTGLVGSALVRTLEKQGYSNIVTRTSQELDLTNQAAVQKFFQEEKPDYVFLAAARVGGIKANWEYPAQFIYDNLMIETNVIHAAYQHGVKSLLFLGSSCIYPRDCPQPIHESYLLQGPLEETNAPYAIAKIAGIILCQSYNKQYGTDFICCMPTNLYGPGDNFDRATGHVLPGLIGLFTEAKEKNQPSVTLWGTGKPYREFLYVDDCAEGIVYLMNHYSGNHIINIGLGEDITIKELAELVKDAVGYTGTVLFSENGLDGTVRKLLNVDAIHALGWHHTTSLRDGIAQTVDWYNKHAVNIRKG